MLKKIFSRRVAKMISFDSQDNIVKIDGDWVQSLNLDNWLPANDEFGVRHDWDNRTIYIKSNSYNLVNASIVGLSSFTTITGNVAAIYIPAMHEFMDNSDVFDIEIEYFLPVWYFK